MGGVAMLFAPKTSWFSGFFLSGRLPSDFNLPRFLSGHFYFEERVLWILPNHVN
jgi:hypothetical protein